MLDFKGMSAVCESVLTPEREALVMTTFHVSFLEKVFGFVIGPSGWTLIESEGETRHQFECDIHNKEFFVNDNKILPPRISKMSGHIKLMGVRILNKLPRILCKVTTAPEQMAVYQNLEPPMKKYVKEILKRQASGSFFMLQSVSSDFIKRLAGDLFKLSKLMTSGSSDAEKENTNNKRLNMIQNIFRGMLKPKMKQILVTNSGLKNSRLNTVYSLRISRDKVHYVEKSKLMKNRVDFDMSTQNLILNGEPMKESAIQWFFDKVYQAGVDLSHKRSQMFKELL